MLCAVLWIATFTGDATWPQWRGPERNGHSPGAEWPAKLEEALDRTWLTDELGDSYSTPIVDRSRVYSTETVDKKWEVVTAYDRASGEEIWSTKWKGSMSVPFFAAKNGSWIRCTPAVDGDRLFVGGIKDVLQCLDAKTGDILWTVDFPKEMDAPDPAFGFVSSPIVDEEAVYVQAGACFAKVDKESGELLWTSLVDAGGMYGSAFASPIIDTIYDRQQAVVLTRESMNGVDLEEGNVLWTRPIKAFRGMNILTPMVWNDCVLTAPYGGRMQLLEITEGDDDTKSTVDQIWENRSQGDMTSPIIIDDHAYIYLRSHRFCCVSLEDGETKWTSGPFSDSYWSLVHRGDKILALNDSGTLRVIEANPSELLVQETLELTDEKTWAHLVVVDNEMYLRSQNHLARFDWAEEE